MRKFKKIYIEISNICNLECDFCPQTMRNPKIMKIDEFKYILDQIKGLGDYIYFHVKGEPLLHPNLEQFLDISYENGLKVNITTNGSLIEKEMWKLKGKKALRQINISLHSFDGNNKLSNKDEYINQVFEFIKSSHDEDYIIALRLWNLVGDNSINKELNKNVEIIERIEAEFNLEYKIEEKITAERGIKIRDRLYLNQDSKFIWPDLDNADFGESGFCYGIRDQIGILADGTVIPCCLDGEGIINLGNIFEQPIIDILNGQRAQEIYDGFSNRIVKEDLCRRCGFRSRF